MSQFIQYHVLCSYGPSNLNRDDMGYPKTVIMGGSSRLRISSQCLKRAWRTSECFEGALKENLGKRTKRMGLKIFDELVAQGAKENFAQKVAMSIVAQFGKLKKPKANSKKGKSEETAEEKKNKRKLFLEEMVIEQLAHFSPEEIQAIEDLSQSCLENNVEPTKDELNLLRAQHTGVDIALFGRMLADSPAFNMEAAVQVSHAVTVHSVQAEDDFFTAVDDLNDGKTDSGSAHLGEKKFGAGVYYLYICVNKTLLMENLNKDKALVKKTLTALTEAILKVSPSGNQNSFASRAYASYLLVEKGDQQPRSLSVAFLKGIQGEDILSDSILELNKTRDNINTVYGSCSKQHEELNALAGKGSYKKILQLVAE